MSEKSKRSKWRHAFQYEMCDHDHNRVKEMVIAIAEREGVSVNDVAGILARIGGGYYHKAFNELFDYGEETQDMPLVYDENTDNFIHINVNEVER